MLEGKDLGAFNIPEEIESYLKFIYTAQELHLIQVMGNRTLTKNTILDEMGDISPVEIEDAYSKAVLNKVIEGGQTKYVVAPIGLKINNLATFHRELWEVIPQEPKKAIAGWHYNNFMSKKRGASLEVLLANENTIVPYEDAITFLKTHEDFINVIPCDCKSTNEGCDFDRNVCIDFRQGPNTPSDRGYGRRITLEEGMEILKHTEKEGLIHTAEKHGLCNCCACCCYPIRASNALGLKDRWPQIQYIIDLNTEKCIVCGKCEKRCQFGVFVKEGEKMKMDRTKCWGCGICVGSCPAKALQLKKPSSQC